jgi:peptidoglycan hydrolase-like protein with peptidoglycan-binding domain
MPMLPVLPLTRPSCLAGQQNGLLADALLVPCGVGAFRMVEPAARAMKALVDAMSKAGFQVRATGTYRTYARQEALFLERYTTTELPGRPTKRWNGVTYWQKPGTAMAAVPGTSNHGLGLAVDFAEERDGDPEVESVSTGFVQWLVANAAAYGYSAEAQSEPWHWRYVTGDAIPAAVLAYEAAQGATPPPPAPVEEHPLAAIARAVEDAKRHRLRLGSGGARAPKSEQDAVKWCQIFLTQKGQPVAVDGRFGQQTDRAVRAFQRRNIAVCRVADGVVGPLTWKALTG